MWLFDVHACVPVTHTQITSAHTIYTHIRTLTRTHTLVRTHTRTHAHTQHTQIHTHTHTHTHTTHAMHMATHAGSNTPHTHTHTHTGAPLCAILLPKGSKSSPSFQTSLNLFTCSKSHVQTAVKRSVSRQKILEYSLHPHSQWKWQKSRRRQDHYTRIWLCIMNGLISPSPGRSWKGA